MAYKDPIKKAESARRWRLAHPEQARETKAKWRKRWREENREKARERARVDYARYREYNPLKDRARAEVRKALRNGTLVKQPCGVCGSTENVEAHHIDYADPLKIQWLCKEHHLELHEGREREVPMFLDDVWLDGGTKNY